MPRSYVRRLIDSPRRHVQRSTNAPDPRTKQQELRGQKAMPGAGRPIDPETASYLASLIDELALLSRERRLDTLAYLLAMAHDEAAKLTAESTALPQA